MAFHNGHCHYDTDTGNQSLDRWNRLLSLEEVYKLIFDQYESIYVVEYYNTHIVYSR